MNKNKSKSIAGNIKRALKEKKLTQDFLARAWNIDQSGVSRYLRGIGEITVDMLVSAADALEISVHLLTYGYEEGAHMENEADIGNDQAINAERSYIPIMQGGIPEIDVLVGAGEGEFGKTITLAIGEETYSGHPVVAEWSLSDKFVEYEMNLTNKDTLILRVIGDSMNPTYAHGDRVIVDMRQKQMTVDGVYIISDGENPPQIKRLQRVTFSKTREIDVISDNSSHRTHRGPVDDIHIIGRVAGRISAT